MGYIIAVFAVLAIVGLDQFAKYLCVTHMSLWQEIPLIDGVFSLLYVENRGAAFGILQGARWLFVGLAAVVLTGIVVYYVRLPHSKYSRYIKICLVLITGGAVGNGIDRALQGYVVDFFYFKLIDFAVFNVADVFLVCGTLCFAFIILFFAKEEKAGK